MKRFLSILALCVMTLTSWMAVDANAQNKIFSKYNDMDDVEYICITKSMLKLLGSGSATINGVHIDGITNALNVVLIINSTNDKAKSMMKADYSALASDPNYEKLMEIRDNGQRITTLLNSTEKLKEVVMYIDGQDAREEQVFIVLTGNFTDQQLSKLLNGNN